MDDDTLLHATITVPAHVVFREFPQETVALNLETGQFHGLNSTASRIVEAVTRAGTPAAALDALAEDYGMSAEALRPSVLTLLGGLVERQLVLVGEKPA